MFIPGPIDEAGVVAAGGVVAGGVSPVEDVDPPMRSKYTKIYGCSLNTVVTKY